MKRAMLIVAGIFAIVASAQHYQFRDVGPVQAPTSGDATLDSLTVGHIDAGTLRVTGKIYASDGTAPLPSYTFLADQDTGIYRSAANSVAISSNGSLALTIDNAGVTVPASHYLALGSGSNIIPTDGTAAFPVYTFSADQDTGLYRVGTNQLGVTTAGTRSFNFSATAGLLEGITSTPQLKLDNTSGACLDYNASSAFVCARSGTSVIAATGTVTLQGSPINISNANSVLQFNSVPVLSSTTPTISSGFGTGASVTAGKAYAFRVNVGTGGTANSGVIALGTTATNGWNCHCTDITTQSSTVFLCKQTASSTTTVTIGNFDAAGAAAAWVASDIVAVTCTGF